MRQFSGLRAVHAIILLLYNGYCAATYTTTIYTHTHIILRCACGTYSLHLSRSACVFVKYVCVYARCDRPAIFHRRRLVNNAALQRMNDDDDDDDDLSLYLVGTVCRVIIHIKIILLCI